MSRRQGPVHHRRAVREHATGRNRGEGLAGHGRRPPQLAQHAGADGAADLRRHPRLRRSRGRHVDLGPGDKEARHRWLRLRVHERLGVSASSSPTAHRRAKTSELCRFPAPATVPRGRRRLRGRDQAKNAKNALAFLSDISNRRPRSVQQGEGVGTGAPEHRSSSLSAYQRDASKSLWGSPVLLSVAHGEAMSPEFQEGFYDAVSTYVRTRDPDAFAGISKTRSPRTRSRHADVWLGRCRSRRGARSCCVRRGGVGCAWRSTVVDAPPAVERLRRPPRGNAVEGLACGGERERRAPHGGKGELPDLQRHLPVRDRAQRRVGLAEGRDQPPRRLRGADRRVNVRSGGCPARGGGLRSHPGAVEALEDGSRPAGRDGGRDA